MSDKKYTCKTKRVGWDNRVMAIKMLESRQDLLAHMADEKKFEDFFNSIYEASYDSSGHYAEYHAILVKGALGTFFNWYKEKSAKYDVFSESKLISSLLTCISFCPANNVLLPIVGALTLIDQEEIPKYLEQGGYRSARITHAVLKWRLRNGV